MRALLGRLLLAAVVVMSTVLTAAPSAHAAGSVSWSVEPVTADGDATGHPWAELTMDPGARREQYLRVSNRGADAVVFSLSAADGYFTDTGRFTMLPAGQPSADAGTWITLPASVSVDPGASVVVPFTVAVPANATPGDHLAGVAAGVFSERDTVGVESRIGFRVLTRVTGDVAPAVSTTVTADYHPSWNPFLPGRLEVRLSTRNTGNTRLTAQNDVAVAGPLGLAPRTSRPDALPELAPGDERQATVTVDDVWPLFAMAAVVTTTAADAGGSSDGVMATTRVTVPAMPWSQLLVVGCAVALVVLALWDRRRRRRRWASMVEEAREQGRRDAAVGVWSIGTAVLLAMGVARRSGASVPTLRYYEERGLIDAVRADGGRRQFPRHVLRRLAVIAAGQRVGLSLVEIAEALASLPRDRAPTQREMDRDVETVGADGRGTHSRTREPRRRSRRVHRMRMPLTRPLHAVQSR